MADKPAGSSTTAGAERLLKIAEDAQRLSLLIGAAALPFLEALAHFIPGAKGERVAKIIAKIEEDFSPAWNGNDAVFEALPPLWGMLNSELKKSSKMDGLHLLSAVQEIALTVMGLVLGMPALGALGFAASSWVAVADVGHQYYAAKRRTDPLYLAEKKIKEIEKLQGETATDPLATNRKINLLITQADALLCLAQIDAKAQPTALQNRLEAIREENKLATPVNGQGEITLNDNEKTALAKVLIQEQKDIMDRCKKEISSSIATAVVMTAMAAVAVLANVAIIAAAVAATPYLPFIIGTGLAMAAFAVGVVRFVPVLDNRLYTHKAVSHADAAGKTNNQLLKGALERQGLRDLTAEIPLTPESKKALVEKEARREYTHHLKGQAKEVISHLKIKAEETTSEISTAIYSFFSRTSVSSERESAVEHYVKGYLSASPK
ncbi:MAG: hypothetical protein K0R48_951 [Gammaproteobacteria bacterium]|jgi:hypothetical protein|nr:hypothetical protein [Gammaproteobacteria bacterium]